MAKVNTLLTQRLKMATEKLSKMTDLAELTSSGNLSGFAGIFRVAPLTVKEQQMLEAILTEHQNEGRNLKEDMRQLASLTSEVKAINNQAAILHGERIKKAQEILKNYRDGAFSAWLVAAYGNRQTPYNFLQYYELTLTLPQMLHAKLDAMPRQAVYALASRTGPLEKKEAIIQNYNGEPKQELLLMIRKEFPLSKDDKRAGDLADTAISTLLRLCALLKNGSFSPKMPQKKMIKQLLNELDKLTEG